MRILDCKSPECQEVCKGAPKITDYLCADCQEHFQKVQDYLTALEMCIRDRRLPVHRRQRQRGGLFKGNPGAGGIRHG